MIHETLPGPSQMKIFTGGLLTETNTFSPLPTGRATFEEMLFLRRGEEPDPPQGFDLCRPFMERGRAAGWEVSVGLRAFAQPAGKVVQSCYEELRDELLGDLQDAMPVDAVFLSLHGAMVAEEEDDGEGDIIERVRQLIGPDVPIGVHIDPHCHLTRKMVDNADVIKIWKEYPHVDIVERANEVFDLVSAQIEGAPRPVPVVYNCGMTQMFHTTREPMRSFVDRIIALEGQNGIQSISIAHSFPWGDVPDLGTRVLVYADDESNRTHAETLAASLGQELWEMREAVGTPYLTLDESLDRAYAAANGPVVISDGPDNAGGGAPADSTWFLRRLLERDERDWAVGYIYDPQSVRFAFEAGEGAWLNLRVGGKTCSLSGDPVDLEGRVTGTLPDAIVRFGDLEVPVGDAAGLDLGNNRHIVLIALRNQTFDHALFSQLGVDLDSKRAVIVKSSQHFHARFSELAADILYAAPPGVLSANLKSLNYEKADTTMWPLADYAE
jgi:microcystin degradation protein MlrC